MFSTGGSLTEPGPLWGKVGLTYRAQDQGSGIYREKVEIDGRLVAVHVADDNGGRCRDPFPTNADPYEFDYAAPCATTVDGRAEVDLGGIATGRHDVRATLEDAAGNETRLYEGSIDVISDPARRAFDVGGIVGLSNPLGDRPGLAVNGANGGPNTRLTAYLVKGRRHRRRATRATLRWPGRHRAVLRLRSGRRAVTGALVTVAERRPGGPWTAVTTLRTSRSGRVIHTLRAGPSRDVRFVYFPTSESTTFLDSRPLKARVAPRVRLRAAPHRLRNGQRVTFHGRVQGPPRPAAGLLLAIQAQAGPRRWITFRVTRADAASGRFHARYRFASTRGTIRYRFRAVVRRQSGYAYASGHSRPTSVTVTG